MVASSAGGRAGWAFLGWKVAVSKWLLISSGWAGPSAPTGGSRWWTWMAHPAWPFRVLSVLGPHRPTGSVCTRTVEQMELGGAQSSLGSAGGQEVSRQPSEIPCPWQPQRATQ